MFSGKGSTAVFVLIINLFFANLFTLVAQQESAQNSSRFELPKGTRIELRMDNEINSKSSAVDDTFTAVVEKPVKVNGNVLLPTGTVITGRITKARAAASRLRGGILEVAFEELRLETGERRKIEGVLVNPLKAKSSRSKALISVISGIAAGTLIGIISKSDNGAAIGAGLGGGAGTGIAAIQKGKEVRIKADEVFQIELTRKVTLPAEGF